MDEEKGEKSACEDLPECKHEFYHEILHVPVRVRKNLRGGGYDKEQILIPHIEIFCVKCGEHRSFEKTREDIEEQLRS